MQTLDPKSNWHEFALNKEVSILRLSSSLSYPLQDSISCASNLDWIPMEIKSDTNVAKMKNGVMILPDSNNNGQCSLRSHVIQNCSGVSVTSESCDVPSFVYQRRRILNNSNNSPVPLHWTRVSGISSSPPEAINFVYERRKHQRSGVTNLTAMFSGNTCRNGGGCNEGLVRSKVVDLTASEMGDGCLVEDRGSDADVKDKRNKTVELCSVDDSCSSSMLDVDIGSGLLKTGIDDTDECSSSGVLVTDGTGEYLSLSTKDLCISILKSHGLISRFRPNGAGASEEEAPSCSSSSSRLCNVCGRTGSAEDMLICDECEEAFHIACCNSSMRNMPIDEWYCQSCVKTKHKMVKERAVRKSSIIRSEKGSATTEGDLSPIALMLEDCESYTTGVRVGKGFQAIVPEWCGRSTEVTDVPEPMELDPSYSANWPGLVCGKPRRSSFIGNWIQCRDVIVGMGEETDGTICGKWRRAPLFEVQTDNWDCFRSVLWDPMHADCAVPQELETKEVLKQLKYIEMLRPRLAAKRRKLEACKADDSPNCTEDASNCTDSTNAARDF